jgi:hypothetical protein
MFALIIGINEYANPTISDLRGAVADAEDVYEFLVSHPALRVPKENIKILRDEEATRANIIKELKALGEDSRIQDHDPILIFYAGHGSFTAAPPKWPGGGEIQMLIPHNFSRASTKDIEGQGILDTQLIHILAVIAKKKSDNIVSPVFTHLTMNLKCKFVLDCHFGLLPLWIWNSAVREHRVQEYRTAKRLHYIPGLSQ